MWWWIYLIIREKSCYLKNVATTLDLLHRKQTFQPYPHILSHGTSTGTNARCRSIKRWITRLSQQVVTIPSWMSLRGTVARYRFDERTMDRSPPSRFSSIAIIETELRAIPFRSTPPRGAAYPPLALLPLQLFLFFSPARSRNYYSAPILREEMHGRANVT